MSDMRLSCRTLGKRNSILQSRNYFQSYCPIRLFGELHSSSTCSHCFDYLTFWHAQFMFVFALRSQRNCERLTILPTQINFNRPARTQSSYRSRGPRLWQRRKKTDLTCMTLQQHLRNRRGPAKVSINLKRRMIVE